MTDMPPPYPGINAQYQGYASGGNPQQHGAWGQQPGWTPQHQNGAPGWANPNYNNQQTPQAGVYPNHGQSNNYPQYPPPYTTYPQNNPYGQPSYPQYGPY